MSDPKTILIVDDSRVSRMLLKKLFNNDFPHWIVEEAQDAAEALRLLETTRYDMISLDYNMPDKDGLTLAQEIRERYPETKMALLTANIQSIFREKVEALGIPFFEKPITEKTAKDLIDVCLG